MLSVSIDPHKRGVLREKNQVSKRENRIGNRIFKNRAIKHVLQVNVFKNTTI